MIRALLGAATALCLAGAAAAAEPADYRFRQAPGATLVQPARDLLEPAERDFLESLPELRVGIQLQYDRPYEVISEQREISGIQIEILTHVAQALGLRLKPVLVNGFPELLDALRERRVDILPAVGYEPARESFLALSLGTAPNPGAIIGRAADPRFEAKPTLDGRRVALEPGFITRTYVRQAYPDAMIIDRGDTTAALRAVALGEDDFYYGSLLRAMDNIEANRIAGLQIKQMLVYGTGQMHFGLRSDWPLLASAFNKAIAATRAVPLPELQAALLTLNQRGQGLPGLLRLAPDEQRQLAARSVLRVGAVRGLTQLNEATPEGRHSGIAADYTQQVAQRLGVAVEMVPFDSVAAMLDALRAGRIHLVPFLTKTPARMREFVFSQPYLEMPYLIVARNDAPLYWDLNSLRGKRVALALQHPLREVLATRYPDIAIVDARNGEDAMDLVAAGQADAAVEVKLFANIRINNDAHGLLRPVSRVDELPAQFHFGASREAASLIPLVDRALADIDPAERGRLLRRWVAIDLSPAFHWQRYRTELVAAAAAMLLLIAASAWWMRRLAREVAVRRRTEARLSAVADGLPGVVFQSITDREGHLVEGYVSAGVEAFLGPGPAEGTSALSAIIGRMPPDEAAALLASRDQSLHSGRPFKQSFRYQDPRGGERWLHCEAVARALDANGHVAWTGFLVDVSGERALQSRLLDEIQAKNLFVATASHELRTPLNAITLALERLGSSPLDAAQRPLWRIAQDSTASLTGLIDDVLDLAKLDAGRLVLRPGRLALREQLQQLVENHRLAAESRGLELTLTIAPEVPACVEIDALRLRQIVTNLVSNAIKYTPRGEVRVSLRVHDTAAGATRLQLEVRDSGIGIAPERQRALFQPFETAHSADDAPREGSSGLGLAICRRLAEAMGGGIALTSVPGQGTEVRVDLPLVDCSAAAPAAEPAEPGALLVVDDDATSRLLLAEMLRQAGFEVALAASCAQALERLRGGGVVAVISDQHMPDGSGVELLAEVAANAARHGTPRPRLLLYSGSAPDLSQTPSAEIDAVLRKPVPMAQLNDTLARLGVRPTMRA